MAFSIIICCCNVDVRINHLLLLEKKNSAPQMLHNAPVSVSAFGGIFIFCATVAHYAITLSKNAV